MSYRLLSLLTGSDYLAGSLCGLQSSAQFLHHNLVLFFTKTSQCVLVQPSLRCTFSDVWIDSKSILQTAM